MSALDYRRKRTSGPGLVGWHLPDEVDMSQGDPEDLPFSNDPGKVTFLTLTDHFSQSSSPPTNGRGIYPKLLARADMIGFDSYPVEGWCKPDSLERVFRLQKELAKLAAPKPTFQWIEAGPMEHCFDVDPTPVQVRAETWLAIAGGARGIGYFPDIWPNDIRAEVGQLNREIVALAPALLQPEGSASAGSRSAVKVGMRRYNGATYLIAVNSSSKRTKALITLPATGTKQLRVFADGRTVDVQGSQLYEDFPPYAARVYIAPPPGW